MSNVHFLPIPEHLAPGVMPAPSMPMNGGDARREFTQLLCDQFEGVKYCEANQIAVLSIGADRHGAYINVAPVAKLRTLFGDECACIKRSVNAGLSIEIWIGTITTVAGVIRVFWREVACMH